MRKGKELRPPVWIGRRGWLERGKSFAFRHDGIVSIDGARAGQDEALGARTGGGGKNEASAFDINFVATIGMGNRFGDADHGGEMKDVGNAIEGIVQGGRLEDRSMEESAGKALEV